MSQSKSRMREDQESHWFGFQSIHPEKKTARVQEVFSSVATRYDLMNDVMSLGLHRLWKDYLVYKINPKPHEVILDVAGGTGDVATRCYWKTEGEASLIVCDLNPAMIEEGRRKALNHGIVKGFKWLEGNAENLPIPSRSVDVYTISFGLRNVTHIDQALRDAYRVLKLGGRFFCMEFSPGVDERIKPLFNLYCMKVLPFLGSVIAQDAASYQYLAESIQKFPSQSQLVNRLKKVGFDHVNYHNIAGGIAVLHEAWKL